MLNQQPRIAIVVRETRLKGMLSRWTTRSNAKFVFRRARAIANHAEEPQTVAQAEADADRDFQEIEAEDVTYSQAVKDLINSLDFGLPTQVIDRQYLPNFDFQNCSVVVVIGQDGLVANTAKYSREVPLVAVNPDPARFDGVLLPFQMKEARSAVNRVLQGKAVTQRATLARATLHDGQTLLAFNDFFLGMRNHTSARYQLQVGKRKEEQSSSGLLVCTGAGSTGWMSSVFNMAQGVSSFLGHKLPEHRNRMNSTDRRLLWAVREPFNSRTSQVGLVMGHIAEGDELVVDSLIASSGVIFSDGIETDFLEFNAGTIARFSVASECAQLVVP